MSKRKVKEENEHVIDLGKKPKKIQISTQLLDIAKQLNEELDSINFIKTIDYVYNPTRYAYSSYECYWRKYCDTVKKVMFLGMNPGPWGMSRTGVPFGEVNIVKEWLKINGKVGKPDKELVSRPVQGFSCTRSEISGKRFWGLMKELCGEPTIFFKDCFVYNYLPLQFMNASGKNLPPTTLKPKQQEELYKVCDEALAKVINLYEVQVIVAIGKFTESRVKEAMKHFQFDTPIKVVSILHPSPQSKAANNWAVDAHKQLQNLGILQYLCKQE